MQRKAYVPGVAALLAALLAGCTGSADSGGTTDGSNPGAAGAASAAAQPGRYRTLPEPCGAVSQGTLDSLLPGIKEITDEQQREKAYAGEATITYDTDRKNGCRWNVESTDATDRLLIDFERVVSYDKPVSDDAQAQELFAKREKAADLPKAAGSSATSDVESGPVSPSATPTDAPAASGTSSPSATASATPTGLQPRLLDDLGDEAFLDDALRSSGSTAQRRTVTVAFRTSNVIVTIEYEEQPTAIGVVPGSKEMQDRTRELADRLADSLAG